MASQSPTGSDIPMSTGTVDVRMIDTTSRRREKASNLFQPLRKGFKELELPSWSFLISHGESNILFDLGIRKDFKTGFPPVFDNLVGKYGSEPQWDITVDVDVCDILDQNHGLAVGSSSILACIWSHHHFDHRGDISRFAPSTELVVGPGLCETYLPGYPSDPEGELAETDFERRHIRKLRADDFNLTIRGFPGLDYFDDGSFYLLSSPGHTNGHLCGLARVTSSAEGSTFVFMGGDCSHHCGVFRPSQLVPLPDAIFISTGRYDGREIRKLHNLSSRTSPFLDVDKEPMCENSKQALESRDRMQAFDGDENVLVCIAHDATLRDLPFFPIKLNDWKQMGLKSKVRWEFLRDFDLSGCRDEIKG